MGKFTDMIKKAVQGGAPQMGFRAAVSAPAKPRLLIIAALADGEVTAELVAGADAALLPAKMPAKSLEKAAKVKPEILWGSHLDAGGAEAGGDFVFFPPEAAVTSFKGEAARVLEVDGAIDNALLHAVAGLPFEAVFLKPDVNDGYRLTWKHLMLVRKCGELAGKPLFVAVPADIGGEGLVALWEAGAVGVVVAAANADAVAALKKLIDKQKFSAPGKRRKAAPLIPFVSGAPEAPPEEDEEDE